MSDTMQDKLHDMLHPTAEALLPRVEEALRRFKNRDCSMRIPVNESDLDIVLRACANVVAAQAARIASLEKALQRICDYSTTGYRMTTDIEAARDLLMGISDWARAALGETK